MPRAPVGKFCVYLSVLLSFNISRIKCPCDEIYGHVYDKPHNWHEGISIVEYFIEQSPLLTFGSDLCSYCGKQENLACFCLVRG